MLSIAYVRKTILEIKLDTEGGYTTIHGQHFRLFNLAVSMELLRNFFIKLAESNFKIVCHLKIIDF